MWPHALKLPNIFIDLLCEEIYWSGLKYTFFVSLGKTEISLLCTSFVSAHCIAKLFKSYLLYSFQN